MLNSLGINTVHVEVEKMKALGLGRVEMCLGRQGDYPERLDKMERDIGLARAAGIPFSIHLPMYLFDWFKYDYLDVYFLDPDPIKRELSYRLLEENLKRMEVMGPEYCVLHFAGVYRKIRGPFPDFNKVLTEALERIDVMAGRYGVRILLEYMGSNIRFHRVEEWIEAVRDLRHVGLLTDTGHLYFASLIHSFDFMEALEALCPASDAFHLWTTKGQAVYSDSEYYLKYHHIIPHVDQLRSENWAFDTAAVFSRVAREKKPMIIEASTAYKGKDYFYDGISSIQALLKNMTDL